MKKRAIITALCILISAPFALGETNQKISKNELELMQQNAFKYYNQQDYSQAVSLCNKVIKYGTDSDKAYVIKIMALIESNKQKEAIRTINDALEVFPDSSILNFYKGCMCYESKEYETAIDYLKKSVNVNPSAEAYHVMGLCFSELGDNKTALKYFVEEYKLPRPMDNLNKKLKEAEKLIELKEYSKAFRIADEASVIDPTYYLPFKIKAIANADMHHYDIAANDINKAIEMHQMPYPLELYGLRGNILYYAAYSDNHKIQPKYMRMFKEDFDGVTKYYSESLDHTPEKTDGEDTINDYLDYLTLVIVSSNTEALYKINTLILMMNSNEIKSRKYSNMYFYKFYAIAMKIAAEASDYDFKRANTTRDKVLSLIKLKTSDKGIDFTKDFGEYLYYKFSGNEEKANETMKYLTQRRFEEKIYVKGMLYEDDIDEILDYVNKFDELISKHVF